MTDNEIIKALECCRSDLGNMCSICPSFDLDNDYCEDELHEHAIDLINRQKAEIERLNVELKAMRGAVYSYKLESERLLQKLQQAQSKAIKEFAELLKRKIWHSGWCNLERTITPEIITKLVKEMTEVQE